MSPEENKAITRRMWQALWIDRQLDIADEIFTPDFVLHVNREDKTGEAARGDLARVWFGSFPDVKATVLDQIAEGDKVCDRLIFSGTHTGTPFLGIEAAGKRFQFTETTISRIENGMIAEMWEDLDFFGLVRQLGVTMQRPKPAEAAPAGA
jgi:predicted ester cyclase